MCSPTEIRNATLLRRNRALTSFLVVGLLHIAAIGLVVAGAVKISNQGPTVGALAGAGVPAGRWPVAALGLGEIVVGLGVLVAGGSWPANGLAALYLGFSAFIALALSRRGDSARCGCFGQSNAPPSRLHVVINLIVAGTGFALAATSAPSLSTVVGGQPAFGVPYLILVGTGSAALYLILDRLPELQAAVQGTLGAPR